MRRRTLLKQIAALPAAGLVASCARSAQSSGPAGPVAPAGPAAPPPPKFDDVTTRQRAWPVKSLTSYSTRDANDLVELPAQPKLIDFLKHRFLLAQHLIRACDWAISKGQPESLAIACLLHDIGQSIARPDHGYWGAQMVAPYVTEEVAWAIRAHQAARFYADAAFGYKGPPDFYKTYFGPDAKIDPYIEAAYQEARKHKWYGTARMITMADQETPEAKDLYVGGKAPDPVDPDKLADVIGRNFKQPKEGLGYDGSPVAHMWRTLIHPTRML